MIVILDGPKVLGYRMSCKCLDASLEGDLYNKVQYNR